MFALYSLQAGGHRFDPGHVHQLNFPLKTLLSKKDAAETRFCFRRVLVQNRSNAIERRGLKSANDISPGDNYDNFRVADHPLTNFRQTR